MRAERQSITHKFSIGGHEGTSQRRDVRGTARSGEIFLTDIGQ